MDPLSDLLRVVRLNGAFFYLVEAAPPWSVGAPEARTLAPQILPSAEHLMAYHILTEGTCWAGLVGEPQVRMQPGDVIVFPQGDPHFLSSHEGRRARGHADEGAPSRYPETVYVGSGTSDTRFVCGFLGIDARPFNPLLTALPAMLHVPKVAGGWLASFPEQAVRESQKARVGADTMLTRMAEMMFIELLRIYVETLGESHTGWLAALKDPVVSNALASLHGEPARDWTLADLARACATSRSVLAEKFTRVVGVPPMQYLAQWRLQLAADQLARGTSKVATIAAQVGYESEAAFSRAFKRGTGLSPAEWRRQRQP